MYYPVERRVASLTTLQRERVLPVQGEVLVQIGDWVGPDTVVARCLLPDKVWMIDVSRDLAVDCERAARYLCVTIGDTVQANEVLAERTGTFERAQRVCRAPVGGQVVALRAGQVLIRATPTTFELWAHTTGQVTDVLAGWGVVISTAGALIRGAWGSGGEAIGALRVVVQDPQEPLHTRALDADCHSALVVAGRILEGTALDEATDVGVQGIIAGSVNAELCHLLQSLPYPVLITEGFGTMPMARHVFTLLQACEGRNAMLGAEAQGGWATTSAARRPELLIPLDVGGTLPAEEPSLLPLQVGMRVRGLRSPYLGVVGTVLNLPTWPQAAASGARLPVAKVQLEDGECVLMPLANLELIR